MKNVYMPDMHDSLHLISMPYVDIVVFPISLIFFLLLSPFADPSGEHYMLVLLPLCDISRIPHRHKTFSSLPLPS